MSRNPYSPPDAPVSTPEEPARERPKQIVWASWLLWASVLLGFVSLYVGDDLSSAMEEADEEFQAYLRIGIVVFMAVSVAVYLWCIDRMRAGRNWARIVLLAFLMLSVAGELAPGAYEASAAYIVTRVLDMVLQVAAMVLMFTAPGSEWFRPRR